MIEPIKMELQYDKKKFIDEMLEMAFTKGNETFDTDMLIIDVGDDEPLTSDIKEEIN